MSSRHRTAASAGTEKPASRKARGLAAVFAVSAVAGLLAGAAGTASAASQIAQSCGTGYISTSGGRVNYTECWSGSYSRAYGTVADTDADGQCAYVNVIIDSYGQEWKACPKGTRTDFDTGWRYGYDAQVQLTER